MNNLITRTTTGIIFVILIIGSAVFNPFIFAFLFLLISILGLLEFYKLIELGDIKPQKVPGIIIGSLLFISITLTAFKFISFYYLIFNIPLIFLFLIIELFRNKSFPFTNIALSIFGILYIVLPLSILNFFFYFDFKHQEHQYGILIGFFIILWINDIFAYLTGTKIGKHKLFERISPKKTWEGSIGGAIFCIIAAIIISFFNIELSLIQWLIMALIIIIFSTLGDLVESLLKRSLNIKDSGNILPGHGGILDRFDGVFVAAPLVFIYLFFI
ncbi:MAG: phosphatidate cytidylyltransferase [Bacteroidales bacterium]|nr:phosphatidate cytidylyltransferase [Bacteroidales bacterium]